MSWDYELAFSRNRGLISAVEQQVLRQKRVAIVGMGGVGGAELVTLARLGIGKFSIADPDHFEVANTNRQYGAVQSNMGRSKAQAMAEIARDINPEVEVRIFDQAIDADNVDAFLDGADFFVDGVDFFEIEVRRLLFRKAAERGIHAITAGPIGFSVIWLVFDPGGVSFDTYFDMQDGKPAENTVAFYCGIAPESSQSAYMDLSEIKPGQRTGPSSGLACSLAAGVVGGAAVKALLGRGELAPAPRYHQFDVYLNEYRTGELPLGNRTPAQLQRREALLQLFLGEGPASGPGN